LVARKGITPILTTSVPVVRKILDAAAGSAPNFLRATGTNAPINPLIIQLAIIDARIIIASVNAVVMYWLATKQNNPHAFTLAIIILASMIASCIISGLMGAFVPVALKKFGADPAAASSIFLTTGTDVVSMGVMPFLATKFIING
jgi:hypothetical protein